MASDVVAYGPYCILHSKFSLPAAEHFTVCSNADSSVPGVLDSGKTSALPVEVEK